MPTEHLTIRRKDRNINAEKVDRFGQMTRDWLQYTAHTQGIYLPHKFNGKEGGRRQGRQRKRWEDNIREWTDLVFGKSQRAVENRGKWRKLVAKSSVVLQRPSRLKDR